ncbi:MAG: NUDIX domain-containing protein [Helicobacteraceae bacterium]|jgi:UDP-sugar diphosphatase|nr:NUDIX domain-containing protein [Helicobacteraceae bacterium]
MVDNVRIESLSNPRFVQPLRVFYSENGVEKSWEMIKAHDSVAILIYNRDQNSFAFVKQFRPAVFLKNNDGFTYELCAGILDKDKSEELTAIEEIEEETGYKISVDRIEKITSFYSSVGFAGSRQTLFFAKVSDNDRVSRGGGVDTENIEVVHIPREKITGFVFDESIARTPGLAFAVSWFMERERNENV